MAKGSLIPPARNRKNAKHSFSQTLEEREHTQNKINRLNQAIAKKDITTLRKLAISKGGFILPGLRGRCWPLLLGFDKNSTRTYSEDCFSNSSREQIHLDIRRSYGSYPRGLNKIKRKKYQDRLDVIINEIMTSNPSLHYYQGYHDISAVFQQIVGDDQCIRCMERITQSNIRDFLASDLSPAMYMLSLVFPLLAKIDYELHDFIQRSGMEEAHFCVSWFLTWFGHSVQDPSKISRLFDFFLAYPHPLMPIYTCVSLLVKKRKEILVGVECEFSEVYQFLLRLPESNLDLDYLIGSSLCFFNEFPPEDLMAECAFDTTICPSIESFPYEWMEEIDGLKELQSDYDLSYYLPVPFEREEESSEIVSKDQTAKYQKLAVYVLSTSAVLASIYLYNNSIFA